MHRLSPFVVLAVTLLHLSACRDEPLQPDTPELKPALEAARAELPAFRHVAAGQIFTCALTTEGLAYCWGSNSDGALGTGDSTGPETCSGVRCTTPLPVTGGLRFRQISAGRHHVCGVTLNGRLFCWGSNQFDQLGNGGGPNSARPIRIARELAFRQVSAGDLHTCAVTTDGAAYCWGHNQLGPLGTGTTDWSSVPVRVAGRLVFREVAAGNQFTCGLTTAGVAYCWGANVGNNNGEICFSGGEFVPCSTRPVRMLRRLAYSQLSAGVFHACGVATDDFAYCWGANELGELGRVTDDPCCDKPLRVAGGLAFAVVSAGDSHTCGVTTDHVGYCWGDNFDGQLGTGEDLEPCDFDFNSPCSFRPVRVAGGLALTEVAAGGSHTCGVTTAGEVWCWGEYGQPGDGTTQDRLRPRRVSP